MVNRIVTADRGDAGRRLDLVLCRRLTDLPAASRTRIQSWIAGGRVTVNGARARRPGSRLLVGDVVAVSVPAGFQRRLVSAEPGPLDVLYEDSRFVALNKPAGVVVHPTYKHPNGTLLNALLWRARSWPAGERPTLVGRIDRLTSGIVIAARTRDAHARLQIAMRTAAKDYLALVYGRPPVRGTIDRPLARDVGDRRRVVAATEGAPSVTRFERLGRAAAPRAGLALLRCRLETGRMHQIRVHLAASGWPIVGDRVYGEPRWQQIDDAALAGGLREFGRQALHAWRLVFDDPFTGRTVTIQAPPPADMVELLAACGLPAQPVAR